MARESKTTTAARRKAPPAPAAPAAPDTRDGLSVSQLARGVLAKDIRPRAVDVRRLAEAVLASPSAKPKKDKKVKADGKKAKGKKLAKIPGQKAKK